MDASAPTARPARRRSLIWRAVERLLAPLIGVAFALPAALLARYPELAVVRFRRGGLPPRVGGWALLQGSAAAITLWRTVFLAPRTPLDPELLLHEYRHFQQFASSPTFPLRYLWESVRRGYHSNPYELDAEQFAARRLAGLPPVPPSPDV